MGNRESAVQLAIDYEVGDTSVDFFDYIIESHINGNFSQVANLYNEMTDRSRSEFILYLCYDSNYDDSQNLHRYISENC